MRLVTFCLVLMLSACGAEQNKSSEGPKEIIKAQQVTAAKDVPASEALPKTLIARVKVDKDGNPQGPAETRAYNGSSSQFAENAPAIADAFSGAEKLDLDSETSTSQCWGRRCGRHGWAYYGNYWNYADASYSYYYPAYNNFYYVNYSYSSYYTYAGYNYYCYSPYWGY